MSADPYRASAGSEDPGSWNRYSYVGNNPINFFDPTGELSVIAGNGSAYGENPSPTSFSSFGSPPCSGPTRRLGNDDQQGAIEKARSGPCNIPSSPGLPSNTLKQNIAAAAKANRDSLNNALQYASVGGDFSTIYSSGLIGWLYQNFRTGANFDYKKDAKDDSSAEALRDFGNFNYGVVLASLGFSYTEGQVAAGYYQALGPNAADGQGFPFAWPYGDSVRDGTQIQSGFAFYQSVTLGLCKW